MLKYKEFKKAVKAIKNQMKHDKECSKAFKVILPNDSVSFYDNNYLHQAIIDLLTITMKDEHELIEMFIYETDFGKKDIELKIDDEEVQLNSIRSLYGSLLYFNDDNIAEDNKTDNNPQEYKEQKYRIEEDDIFCP
jgi:hypothetical protein